MLFYSHKLDNNLTVKEILHSENKHFRNELSFQS